VMKNRYRNWWSGPPQRPYTYDSGVLTRASR
jgi:hypothetical protein